MRVLALNAGSSSVKFAILDAGGTPPSSPPRPLLHGEVDLGARRHAFAVDADGRTVIDEPWGETDAAPRIAPATATPGRRSTDAGPTDAPSPATPPPSPRAGPLAPARSLAPGAPADPAHALMDAVMAWLAVRLPLADVQAVGHRIVMGGTQFRGPVRVDAAVLEALEAMIPLAPLHQPGCTAGVRAAMARFPGLPQVACLDTAFHRDQPWHSEAFALPRSYHAAGVRRFGFHGLSYAHLVQRLRQVAPGLARGKVVAAHLGNGASMCAIDAGRSVATTMGFSALDGLPMGTRCGQIDPGVLLWLMQSRGMDADAISTLLYRESGLKGLSGLSGDMRTLEASDRPEAAQAIDYYVHRARRELGALAVAMGGLDGIVFTGGVGEHSARVRAGILEGLDWLGVRVSTDANARLRGEGRIDAPRARVPVWVIPADEESTIAREVVQVLGG